MSTHSTTQNSRETAGQQRAHTESSPRSRLIPLYQSLLVRLQVLESVTGGHDEKLKKQILRLLNKTALSLKDERKVDIAESQLVEAKGLIQQWEKVFEERRSSLVALVEKMLLLAEKSFLSVQVNGFAALSSEDQNQYICDLLGEARAALDSNNAATAMTLARKAIDVLIDDRQLVLSRQSQRVLLPEFRNRAVDVLSSATTRVHQRLFELEDIRGISQTASRQGVTVVKVAIIARAEDIGRILAPLVGNSGVLSADTLKSQNGLNLFRVSIEQKCTLYLAAIPMERLTAQFNTDGKFSFSAADVLDQFVAGLVYVKDTSIVDDMEKTAIATSLLRLPERTVRVTRNRIGVREEMISLIKSL